MGRSAMSGRNAACVPRGTFRAGAISVTLPRFSFARHGVSPPTHGQPDILSDDFSCLQGSREKPALHL